MTSTETTSLAKSNTSTLSADDSPANINDNVTAFSDSSISENNAVQEDQKHNDDHNTSSSNLKQNESSSKSTCSPSETGHQNEVQDRLNVPTTPANTLASTPQPSSKTPADTHEAELDVKPDKSTSSQQQSITSNISSNIGTEQKRPMNAFLLFCKRQRSLVREKYPNLENRGITKILGDEWTKLDKEQKSKYTDLARQHKEAFMKANPDFKWCKTPNVTSLNNNNSNTTASVNDNCTNNQNIELKHQQHIFPAQLNPQLGNQRHVNNLLEHHHQPPRNHHMSQNPPNFELMSIQSVHNHKDIVMRHNSINTEMNMTNRQQMEAPKPPKKRFLERNDSIYSSKDNSSSIGRNEPNLHGADIVPCISLDQDTLDRVIDKAFSEDSNSSKPSGTSNSCKCSNGNPTNLTSSLGNNISGITSFSATNTSSNPCYPMNVDEPVDFSMNRTINTTRQQIINNLVEKMLSEPSEDSPSSFSRINGLDVSMKSYTGPPLKKDKSDAT